MAETPPNVQLAARRSDQAWPRALRTSPNTRCYDETPPPPYRATNRSKTSLDILQRIERKLAQYNASRSVCRRWLFEILSVVTSALCMGIIHTLACDTWN
jgi:hypothetical protein